jgi:hypothetical protein
MAVLWQSFEWDYVYLLKIIKKKLELMEDFYLHSEQAYSLDAEKTADNIRESIIILDRLINCDYLDVALEKFVEKYPDYTWEIKTKPSEDHPGCDELIDDMDEEQHNLFMECSENAEIMETQDYKNFFDLLNANIRSWWD